MSKRYPGGIIRKTPQTPSQTSAQGIWDMASVTQAVKENTWPIAGVPDPISKSLRFRSSASAYLNRTLTTPTNQKIWTWSSWIKRGALDSSDTIFSTSDNYNTLRFSTGSFIIYGDAGGTMNIETTQVFRDPAAWYHFVIAFDSTQATASNRVKFYVNGTQVTSFITATYPSLNATYGFNSAISHAIGRRESTSNLYFDGYMTEVYFVDGQALTPSSFGNTNDQTGVWQPIAYTGTYGTNGFYLPFSNTASTSTLGYDFSGNSNNWTTNNISLTTGTSIQTFSTTGTTSWTAPTGVTSVNYLVVAGGGSGGAGNGGGGGGGAGGLLTGTLSVTPGNSYTVTVGAGGTGTGSAPYRNSGGNSVFGSITATGGGGGGYDGTYPPLTGGSGGGGNYSSTAGAAGTGGQGFAGGNNTGTIPAYGGGGGGGSNNVGAVGTSSVGGNGGPGTPSSISGSSVTYAGGGGGGVNDTSTVGIGAAGGGNGGANSGTGGNATANTGSGGGGGGGGSVAGGNGGSGIVILSWTNSASTYDSMNDVPTQWIPYNTAGDTGALWRGNYCVLNAINTGRTLSNGNLNYAGAASGVSLGTIAVSSGKWYWETVLTGAGGSMTGIATATTVGSLSWVGSDANSYGYYTSGQKYTSGSGAAYGASWTTNDVIGVALDMDAGTLTFYKNNTSQGTAYSGLTGSFVPAVGNNSTNDVGFVNFGQRPFSYTPPSGFKTLNTTNLPTPTIGATASTTANKYFDATLYTGTGATQTITNSGSMQPDWAWIKVRSTTGSHALADSVRGSTIQLASNNTDAEITRADTVTSFNSNGFSLGANTTGYSVNLNTATYVAWQWRASNATAVTNTAGSITSTVSANTTAGFSIVTYTGTGANATVGHGLGVAPSMVIVKMRSAGGNDWQVYHSALGQNKILQLNLTTAVDTITNYWYNGTTSTVFGVNGSYSGINSNGATYVAYCFAQVAGYSAFGSYTGNGSTDGTFVYLGFRPRFIMVKKYSSTENWAILDSSRSPSNVTTADLYPDLANAEDVGNARADLLSNGIKFRTGGGQWNLNGADYIYMAFAENPFKYSLAR